MSVTDPSKSTRQRDDIRREAARAGDELTSEIAALLAGALPGREDPVLRALAGEDVAEIAGKARWSTLVINPGSTTTEIAVYSGLVLLAREAVRRDPGEPDGARWRVDRVLDWLEENELSLGEISGIAAMGGAMAPVPAGTYRVTPEMLRDLAESDFPHPANLAAEVAASLGEKAGEDVLVAVVDPASVDERTAIDRLTASRRVRDEVAVAHYLDHRAVAELIARVRGVDREKMQIVTCQLGGGMSAVLHELGRMTRVSPAFGGMPSANRCGALPLYRVLEMLGERSYSLGQLRRELTTDGGLLALAGTDDFSLLRERAGRSDDSAVSRKVELVLEFYADRIARELASLCASMRCPEAIALSGGLARDEDLCAGIGERLHLGVPLVRVPGGVEQQALAAGLLRAQARPGGQLSYDRARELTAERRETENLLFDTEVFPAPRRRLGGPPADLEEIIERACGADPPTIALVGADNAEALLAVKNSLRAGSEPMARFCLLGPYAAVSQLAWEHDVPLDGETVIPVDTDDPVALASEMLTEGVVDTLMKGSCMTSAVLKGYLGYLKEAGKTGSGLRLSHLGLFELADRGGLLGVTDAAMNTYPDVEARLAILDNALEAMKLLGYRRPKVAVISAVEKPSDAVTSSTEGREIARRLEGREDLIVEGPLSVDIALSPASAREKKYGGRIRGDADLLLVPDIDAGNAVYKSFTIISGATIAGAIIGGEVPLVLTSRGDSARSKLASLALACLMIRRRKGESAK
ncbi:MAG: phosphate acyltransferase [Polyangia bacterium]